jgi:hypothetical protein
MGMRQHRCPHCKKLRPDRGSTDRSVSVLVKGHRVWRVVEIDGAKVRVCYWCADRLAPPKPSEVLK